MPDQDYCYPYPRPSLTVDAAILRIENNDLKVLLIKRGDMPYKESWAFPGGFVDEGETVEEAVVRELKEETGLSVQSLLQFYTASAPGRDPRGWTVSVIFTHILNSSQIQLIAGDDAADASWHSLNNLPPLAFDHAHIIEQLVNHLSIQFNVGYIPAELFNKKPSKAEIEEMTKLLNTAKQALL